MSMTLELYMALSYTQTQGHHPDESDATADELPLHRAQRVAPRSTSWARPPLILMLALLCIAFACTAPTANAALTIVQKNVVRGGDGAPGLVRGGTGGPGIVSSGDLLISGAVYGGNGGSGGEAGGNGGTGIIVNSGTVTVTGSVHGGNGGQGSIPGSRGDGMTVGRSGTLKGTGTIHGNVYVSGTVSPGR